MSSFARNVNFNQLLNDKGIRQDEELRIQKFDAETKRIAALRGIGGGSADASKPDATTPVKTPTFSNLIAKGGSTLPASMAPAAPGPLPLNEGMPGSGTMGRTMFSTDYAGGVVAPNRAGYQTVLEAKKGIAMVTDPTGNGSPTEDTVDAKLAEGEAVLNAGAAKIVGREGIAALNERGLKEMGMEGAQPEFVDGEVRAYAGIDFNDPAMKESAQNMEMRRRLAAGVRQPVAQPAAAPVQAAPAPSAAPVPQKPPIYSVTEMGDPYTKEEMMRNAERAKVAQAAQAQAASRAVAAPAANIANPSIASKAMSAGGKLLRAAASAPAAGIMAMMQSGEAGAAADDLDFAPGGRFRTAPAPAAMAASGVQQKPAAEVANTNIAKPAAQAMTPKTAAQTFAARGVTKEDRSNYDLAEQGFGGVVRKAGNVYTDAGANPYLNQQFKEHDGMTGKQLLDQRISLDATRQAEAAAKEDKAQLDALEKADPRVRIARIEKEGTAAMKKAEQDAAVNLAREQNPKLTKAQEMAIRYGVKDAAKDATKSDDPTDALNKYSGWFKSSLQIGDSMMSDIDPAEAEKRQMIYNRAMGLAQESIAKGEKPSYESIMQQATGGGARSFASSADVEAAAKAGQIKPGDKVIVNGRPATWQ